jgi:hypothetical protein
VALIETGFKTFINRLPKVISPEPHAVIDYAAAGSFFLAGGLMWRSSKRAAIASLACGAAVTTISLLTDYPGGAARVISFETHGKLDAGLSGMLAVIPTLLALRNRKEAIFFRTQGVGVAAVVGMTDFEGYGTQRRRRAA